MDKTTQLATSPEAPQVAPVDNPTAVNSLESLRADIEKNRETNKALYSRVESWILGAGSKSGENKIDFGLWSNAASAEKDLQTIFQQFPEFEKICNSEIIKNDPSRKQDFIKLFREQLSKKVVVRQEKKRELAELGKEKGMKITDYIESGLNNFGRWKARGQPEDYIKMGGTIVLLSVAILAVKDIVGAAIDKLDTSNSLTYKLLVGGGITAGVVYGLKKSFEPESAYDKEDSKESNAAKENPSAEQKRIEGLVEKNGLAKTVLGLTNAPVEKVLEAYRKSENFSMNPAFLANHTAGLDGFDKKWATRMINQIKPADLYQVTNITFKNFENSYGYKKALAEEPTLTLLEYIQREYVAKAQERNTTITFSEFAEDALRAAQEKAPLLAKDKTSESTRKAA